MPSSRRTPAHRQLEGQHHPLAKTVRRMVRSGELCADGLVLLSAFGGSTVNVCGTVFKNVDPANVMIDPAPMPCP